MDFGAAQLMPKEINLTTDVETEEVNQEAALTPDVAITNRAKRILEGLLFASPLLSLEKMRTILEEFLGQAFKPRQVKTLLDEMRADYEARDCAFSLVAVADGYCLRTTDDLAEAIARLSGEDRPERLSQAALEVLAIVVHKQPVTRLDIEQIRGVDCSGTVQSLQERGFIAISGRKDTPGRPALFSVTKSFLQHFGLASRDQLSA